MREATTTWAGWNAGILTGNPDLPTLGEPGLKVSMGFVDGYCVPKAEVKEFPQALDWLFCQCWDGGLRDGEVELIHQILFL